MNALIRKEFLANLKYDLWCAETKPAEFQCNDEFWGIWLSPEIPMVPRDDPRDR